jgi:branched-subunit amino acid aminotransferase/4-amino-4-deoxychorismate lyase
MIWHDGAIVADQALAVGVDDRVFEHGLGLFETFRTWDGRAPLLGRHLERLRASARDLGIDLVGVRLPDAGAVEALLGASKANFDAGDALLRLTVTAGSTIAKPVAWLTARTLPPSERLPLRLRTHVCRPEPSAHAHKMLNYWTRLRAYEEACERGGDEALLVSPHGRVWEGSRNNVLIVPSGRPLTLSTPSLHGPVLPGIMRRVALEFASSQGFAIEERDVGLDETLDAEAVFLTNSVRGIRSVGWIDDRVIRMDHPETARLLGEDLPSFILSLPGAVT